jgi:lysophospholipase L1-like esterase
VQFSLRNILIRGGFLLLLPIAAIQGLRLRKTAIRLPEASGHRTGVCGAGEALHLVAMGDSIIAGVGTDTVSRSLPVQFARALASWQGHSVHWSIEGTNGADIAHLRKQVAKLHNRQQADVVLISIGVNDVTGLSSTWYWRAQLLCLIKELRNKWPQASIIFAGLPPMSKFPLLPQPLRFTLGVRAARLDAIAAEILEDQPRMRHIPTKIDPSHHSFCEDGFHPSADACIFWAEGLAQHLKSGTLRI